MSICEHSLPKGKLETHCDGRTFAIKFHLREHLLDILSTSIPWVACVNHPSREAALDHAAQLLSQRSQKGVAASA